jgi:hypothetical protein
MYDAYNPVISWMVASGLRVDERDARQIAQLRALREAKRSARRPLAPFAWIRERLGARTTARTACDPLTCSATA